MPGLLTVLLRTEIQSEEATMELDATGWPHLPTVGSRVRFVSGDIIHRAMGECTVVRADHVVNATGKPGGRILLRTDRNEFVSVLLSQLRQHGELIADGLQLLELEQALAWAREHG